MMFRVLLYLCGGLSGITWFLRTTDNIRTSLSGENALLFLTMTVAFGFAAVCDAIDHLKPKQEMPDPSARTETTLDHDDDLPD